MVQKTDGINGQKADGMVKKADGINLIDYSPLSVLIMRLSIRFISSWRCKVFANFTLSLQSFCPLWKAVCFAFPVFVLDLVGGPQTLVSPQLWAPTWMKSFLGAGTTSLPHKPI
jgi:hypothetical protein